MTSHDAPEHRRHPIARDAESAPESNRARAMSAAPMPIPGLAASKESLRPALPDDEASAPERLDVMRRSFLQRATSANGDRDPYGGRPVDDTTASALRRRRSAGKPLDRDVAADLSTRLDADVAEARVHTDAEADSVARSMDAAAFTLGSDIFFSRGAYAPRTRDGRALLAHELTHVKQHRAGRSVTRTGAGGLTVGRADDPAEREAEAAARSVADGAPMVARGRPIDSPGTSPDPTSAQEQQPGGTGNGMPAGVVRRTLGGDLKALTASQLQAQFKIPYKMARDAVEDKREFSTIEQIRSAFEKPQVEKKPEVVPDRKPDKVQARPIVQLPKVAPKKQHTPVSMGGTKLILNFVSLGSDPLDAVAKFNIYSWRALGHDVHLYTHTLKPPGGEGRSTRGIAELGLDVGDAEVHDLTALLGADSGQDRVAQEGQDRPDELGSPLAEMTSTRSILSSWLANAPKDLNKDYIFNVVDVTKSYLGATRRGITLDLKVGPSLHLQDYAEDFANRFVSYSRGGKAVTVENQSMGTMQEGDELRSRYARTFDKNFQQFRDTDPVKNSMFNAITGFHQRGYRDTDAGIDVATTRPTRDQSQQPLDKSPYKVPEIGPSGHGPFRVFKKASDQTNQNNPSSTNNNDRVNMMADALRLELKNDRVDADFLKKATDLEARFRAEIRKKEQQ